jgi:hypothetical protein
VIVGRSRTAARLTAAEVTLSNGAIALVRAVDLDGGATKTKFGDRFDFTDVAATLEGLSEVIRASLVKAAPDTVTVELGLEMAVKAGKLTGLVEGEGSGSLAVTLEWQRNGNSGGHGASNRP